MGWDLHHRRTLFGMLNEKIRIIDRTGKTALPFQYDDMMGFGDGAKGVAVKQNGQWGYLDENFKLTIPFKYEVLSGLAEITEAMPAKLNGKWGFVDKTGKELTGFLFDTCIFFSNGLGIVMQIDKCGLVDKKGKTVVPFKYAFCFLLSESLACVTLENGKECYYDIKAGQELTAYQYSAIRFDNMEDDLVPVSIGYKLGPFNVRKKEKCCGPNTRT